MRLKLNHLASTDLIHNPSCFSRQQFALLAFGVVMLATLACSLLDGASTEKSSRIIIRQILPTLTPTVNPDPNSAALAALTTEATPPQPPQATSPVMMPAENPNSVGAPSPAPFEANSQQASNGIDDATSSDPTITPIAAPTPDSAGWSFTGVEVYRDEFEAGLALYGDVINETGSTQELNVITATFYDGQGQVIADASSAVDYWPIDVIPAGARLPFGILAPDVESATNFELNVEAQSGAQMPHQNFQVLSLDQQQAEFGYCLTGQVQNMGNPLQEYLVGYCWRTRQK